jgi:hypothetical protein
VKKAVSGGEFGIIIAAKHGAMAVLSSMQRNAGHVHTINTKQPPMEQVLTYGSPGKLAK